MIKRFPSRNSRSKGVKVKHILQICLLLGVCLWLIYQVKHSHDKNKAFDQKDAKVAIGGLGDGNSIVKLGRKDLHPRDVDATKNDKPGEDEDDETVAEEEIISEGGNKHAEEIEEEHEVAKHEEEEEREDISKQEDEETDEDETKHEEEEKKVGETEEGGGGGDEEIDEHDHDKLEGENVEEDATDEEKEREGEVNEDDEKDAQAGDETLAKDVDQDDGSQNSHGREAREEHYRADDASSAVAHDGETETTESEEEISENTNEITNAQENSDTSNANGGQMNSTAQLEQGEMDGDNSSDVKISLPSSENRSTENTTATVLSDDHHQTNNDSTVVNPETGPNSLEDSRSLTEVESDSAVQNAATGDSASGEVSNLKTSETTSEPLKASDETVSGNDQSVSTPMNNVSEAADRGSANSTSDAETAVHNQAVGDESTTGEENEKSVLSNLNSDGENPDKTLIESKAEATHDPIDSSDSTLVQEENAGLGTDLHSLGNENVAAE